MVVLRSGLLLDSLLCQTDLSFQSQASKGSEVIANIDTPKPHLLVRPFLLINKKFLIYYDQKDEHMKNELVPTVENDEQWLKSFENAFALEKEAFRQLPPSLLATHKGQFIALSGEKIVDQDLDEITLAKRVARMPQDKFILITRIAD